MSALFYIILIEFDRQAQVLAAFVRLERFTPPFHADLFPYLSLLIFVHNYFVVGSQFAEHKMIHNKKATMTLFIVA